MSEEDKKLQKHLVDEMMKVYETNPDVMLYMQSLMENYEKLEQENKHLNLQLDQALKDYDEELAKIDKAIEYIKYLKKISTNEWKLTFNDLLEILGDDKE